MPQRTMFMMQTLHTLIRVLAFRPTAAMALSSRVVALLKDLPVYASELAKLPIKEQCRLIELNKAMLPRTACWQLLARYIAVAEKTLDICICDRDGPMPPGLAPPGYLRATAAPTPSPITGTADPLRRAVPPPTVPPVKRRRVSEHDLKNPV